MTPNKISLALIQGNNIARYEGTEQKEVYFVDWSLPEVQNNLFGIIQQVLEYRESK